MIAYFLGGCAIYGIVLFVLVMLRPKSALHTKKLTDCGRREKITIGVVLVILILLCTLPMGLAPGWNGEDPGATNQYELLAEAILNGHISIDNGDVDPLLLQMDNPYDPQARVDLGVDYRWDTGYYHGHYYMYFGVVPVFLLFLPFRLITGMSLTTYHATQVFVAFFICGVFANFYMMSKRFFKKITLGMYLMLASAFSIMSIWYSVDAPALYCTAITGALCMEIWSLFFFMRAVWVEQEEKKSIRLAFFGSLFGALAFGCRPPVALANLFVIPMLVVYLKKHKFTKKLFGELVVAAMPYVVIGILLMCYNYARFESPFEFGQAYQLTAADQSSYGSIASYFSQTKMIAVANAVLYNFVNYNPICEAFPYVIFNGILLNFPILWFAVIGLSPEGVLKRMKEQQMRAFIVMLFVIPLVIAVMDALWSPFMTERYRMDQYWIMGVLCFLVIGFYHDNLSETAGRKFSCFISLWAFITIGKSILLYLVQNDGNVTYTYPEVVEQIKMILRLGIGAG